MAKRAHTRAGSKLGRTETVTVRLDPRLNYLCELAARSQRRTKSSFIENAIADKVESIDVDPKAPFDEPTTLGELAETLWSVREHERLIALATIAPHLMTYEEQEIWALIKEEAYFWRGHWVDCGQEQEFNWRCERHNLDEDRVAEFWASIVAVANKEDPSKAIPKASKRRPKPTPDLDDEIPF